MRNGAKLAAMQDMHLPEAEIDASSRWGLKASVRSSSRHVAAGQIVAKLAGLAVSIYIFHKLSVGEQGVYNWFMGTVIYFSYLTTLGVNESLQRYVPEYHANGQYRRISRTFTYCAFSVACLSVLVFSLTGLYFRPLASFFKKESYEYIFVFFAFGAGLFLQYILLYIVLNGLFLHRYQVWGQVAYIVLKGIFMFALFQAGYGLKAVFLADILAYTPVLAVLLILYRKWIVPKLKADATGEETVEVKRVGSYAALNLATAPGTIMYDYSTDYLIIAHYLSDETLGLYSFSVRASRMFLQMLPQKMIETVIRPAFYAKYATTADKKRALHEMFNTLCRINLFFLVPMMVVLAVGGRHIIPLLGGRKFLDAYPTLVWTFAFICVSFFELPVDLVIQSTEKIIYRSIAQVFSIFRVAAVILVVKAGYGITIVAIVTGCALLVKNVFIYYFARKHGGIRFEWASFAKIAVNALAAGASVYGVLLVLNNVVGLILGFLLGAGVYLLMTFLLSPFTSKEREHMLFMVRRRAR